MNCYCVNIVVSSGFSTLSQENDKKNQNMVFSTKQLDKITNWKTNSKIDKRSEIFGGKVVHRWAKKNTHSKTNNTFLGTLGIQNLQY